MIVKDLNQNLVSGLAQVSIPSSGGVESLQSVEPSICFDCDATVATSYDGTTTFKNLVATPADGATQSEYDWDISSMGFSGTVGDAASYLTTDGNGRMTLLNPNPPLFELMASTNASNQGFLGVVWFTNDTDGNLFLYDTRDGASGTNPSVGAFFRKLSTEAIQLYIRNRGGISLRSSTGTMTLGQWNVTMCSWNQSNVRYWVGGSATSEVQTLAFPSDPTFTNNDQTWVYEAQPGGNRPDSSTLTRGIFGGNTYLDDTKAGNIIAALAARHSDTYT